MLQEQLLIYQDMTWLGISTKFKGRGRILNHDREMLFVYTTNTVFTVRSCITSHYPRLIIMGCLERKWCEEHPSW